MFERGLFGISQTPKSRSDVYEDELGMRHPYETTARSTQVDHFGKGPKGYVRSDERIKEDVLEALTLAPGIDASAVEVAVSEGLVTLSGLVRSRSDKWTAEYIVADIPGVQDVHNHLSVYKKVQGWIPHLNELHS